MCDHKFNFMMNFFSFVTLLLFLPTLLAITPTEPWTSPPRWASLERYNDTITATELEKLLQTVYVPDGSWKSWITITPQAAFIEPYPGAAQRLQLSLAPSRDTCKKVPRYWKTPQERSPLPGKPLAGLNIALDPGHLGGAWSKMEERWFRIGKTLPVEEGTMTFLEAQLIANRLRGLGATVQLTKNHLGPTTPLRPSQLHQATIDEFHQEGRTTWTHQQFKMLEEILFYRTAEIHYRAQRVNQELKPDLVICLHFDAEEWGNPKHPQLIDSNRLHILISGNFNGSELKKENDRYIMLRKLLGQVHYEEVGIADAVSKAFEATTTLPPFTYHNPTKARPALAENPYLWNRNLLASRLMEAPVIFCEAYSMNDPLVFQRIQLGDYDGKRLIHGKKVSSIYREYAKAVTQGLVNYFGK
jgi:N-acetylmuramoyl-L-alanine amidase